MKKTISLILLALSLQGCFVAFIAGAAAGGLIVYDRRSLKTLAQDNNIEYHIENRINQNPNLARHSHIVVAVFNHVVLLAGQASTPEVRSQVVQIARQTPHVARIYNEINIKAPTSAMTRTSDSWLTTKTRTAMLTKKGLHSSQIKVVSENGVIYLMGIVTHQQANLAVAVARRISGVQKVVKIFEYTNS